MRSTSRPSTTTTGGSDASPALLLHTASPSPPTLPRHSWATEARNRDIPLSVISAALGHTSERTTQIYLATLSHSVIDDANRRILEELAL